MSQGFSSIFEEIKKDQVIKGRDCSVNVFIEKLNDKERAEFLEILNDENVTTMSIVRVLVKNQMSVSRNALYAHRMKTCRCFHVAE